MKIENNCVVGFHYTVSEEQLGELAGSVGDEPLLYLHGHKNIVPGLESAMEGRESGERFQVTLNPDDAYGAYDNNKVTVIDRQSFAALPDIQVGMHCQVENEQGQLQLVTILEIGDDEVAIDTNHPYAGKTLTFDVEITAVRKATDDECQVGRPAV